MTRPVTVIDAETDPFEFNQVPRPFAWGFYDGHEFRHWWGVESELDLVRFLCRRRIIVYAHNGGRFDYHYLLDYIRLGAEVMVINGRLARFMIGVCEFRDSWNILPVPLASYKKDKIDYQLMRKGVRDRHRDEIVSYLRTDCVSLHELVTRFIAEFGQHLTIASASMHTWEKMMSRKAPRSSPAFYEQFKPYYHGGRVQCFDYGCNVEPFGVYDIVSAYPRAMLERHPMGLAHTLYDAFPPYPPESPGAALIKLEARSLGAFPHHRSSGEMWFPADNELREFFITGWELVAALKTGHLKDARIISCAVFHELDDFAQFILHCFNERKQAKAANDVAATLFYKLEMNSLSGKFGANPDEYEHHYVIDTQMAQAFLASGRKTWGRIGPNRVQFAGFFGTRALGACPLVAEERRYYNVATVASITGFVRAQIWEALCAVGLHNAIYCDTDSIVIRGDAGHALDLGQELGQWQHEGDFDRWGIGGKKLYVFEGIDAQGELVRKAASKGAKLSARQLWRVCQGQTIEYKQDAPTFSAVRPVRFLTRKIQITTRRDGASIKGVS